MDGGAERDVEDVIRVARGDTAALGALYDRHAPQMLAVAERILRSRREAEDLLHDVFVEVWKRAGDYDPRRGNVRGWLLLRVRSRALDRVRSAAFSRGRPLVEERDVGSIDAGDTEVSTDHNAVRQALMDLPEEQRTVLVLGYFEGLSSSEIATRVGVPIGTVKSRVAAAMSKLRSAMGGE
jgi:RNA polymerase sigma-70 factor (ECF subfamily)